MKLSTAAVQILAAVGSLPGALELLAPAARLIWSEGPQLADWIGICADLIASIANVVA
ncbi:hypothetical protein KTN05_13105 [Paracoccus sp. Z118]|uniref:hypothetical protein n=1 Tax=Paracoccus sp. Z118 TaxID=2851017 RepID=UPI001C2C0E73|nr:hypothetical protein [Paracoccus sp. Z118]MBV0892784.1 hypothetical protein [Paracoccus sp. Z118]